MGKIPPWTAIFTLICVLAITLVALVGNGLFEKNDITGGLFSLFGTFIGALLAFRLEQHRDNARELKRRSDALNHALLVLIYHQNEIRTYRELLAPFKNEVERAINLPASDPSDKMPIAQKFDDLTFLIESGHPFLLFEIIIEQTRFEQAIESVRLRNEFYVREFQPVFAAKGLNGRLVSKAEMISALGEYLFESAITGANDLHEHIEASNKSLPELFAKVRKVAKELYPKYKFLHYENQLLPHEVEEQAAKQAE